MENKKLYGHIAAIITIFIWGTTFISTKVLLNDFKPMEILFFRFVIGYAALWAVSRKLMHIKEIKHEIYFIFAGISGVTLYFLLENFALTYTLAANVGVIIAVAPFFTAVLNYLFNKGEKPKPKFFAGFACAMAGIYLISFRSGGTMQLNPKGDMMAVGAAALWAVYSILTKKISEIGYNNVLVTRRIFFYGIVFMIPEIFIFDFSFDLHRFADIINLSNILFLGLGASALCFASWGYAVKILGSVKTSAYIYMNPVITVIFSIIILGEQITFISVIGMLLALSGLFISEAKFDFLKFRNFTLLRKE